MTEAWGNEDVAGSELLLLLALCDHANDEGVCWPSIKTLSRKVRVQKRSVTKLIEKLESKGLLERLSVGGGLETSVYQVSPSGKGGVPQDRGVSQDRGGSVPQDTPSLYKEPSKGTTKGRRSKMKENWQPSNPQYASDNNLDPEGAIEFFKNWAIGSGKAYADWDATWRNACRTWLQGKGIPAPTVEFPEQDFIKWMEEKGWLGKATNLDVYRIEYLEEKGLA